MGFLDEVSSLVGGNADAGGAMGVAQHLLDENGGLQGLLDTLQQGGLAEHVASWVGNGQNLSISPDQIQAVLGNEQVAALAGKLGIDPQQAASQISQYLPDIVNHLTPNGDVPQGSTSDLLAQGEGLLKGLFNRG